jgi:hypothetical protein
MSKRKRCSGSGPIRPTSRPAAHHWCGVPDAFVPPAFALHPVTNPQIFPLSWGFDNEVLLSTVFHSDWPAAEQITGPKGPRGLPSGLDLAAATGQRLRPLVAEDRPCRVSRTRSCARCTATASQPQPAQRSRISMTRGSPHWPCSGPTTPLSRQRAGHTLECEKDPDGSRFLGHAAPRNRARQREIDRGVRRGRL